MFCGSQVEARRGRVIVGRLSKICILGKVGSILLFVGCGQNFSEKSVEESLRDKGLRPLTGVQEQPQSVPEPVLDGARSSLGGINVIVPQGWSVETPSSSMRLAEYRLPSAEGDGTLAVFRFGPGQGGGVEANLDRWLGQFQQPDGRDSRDVARLWTEEVDGLSAHLVDVSGTFSVGAMSGGSGEPQPNYSMLGAIIEAPSGMFVFKLTGPESSIMEWRTDFLAYIQSTRSE